jgi:hypothetical protein
MAIALLACAAFPARAGMGPCRQDATEGLACGEGAGAARVIDDTTSPDQRLALAWRNPRGEPTAEPDQDDQLEIVLVRLADGAILASGPTGYWDIGRAHADRLWEEISWSPDSRLAVHAFHSRLETDRFEVFAVGDGAARAATFDLMKILSPALTAKLRSERRDPTDRVASVSAGKNLSISNTGLTTFTVMMWLPKDMSRDYYDVALQVARGNAGISARIVSIKKGKEQK